MLKKFISTIAVIAMTATSAFSEGLVSEGEAPDDDFNWSAPIYAQAYHPGADLIFDDVKDTDWFYDDVTYIVTCKLMEGYDDNTFAPADRATEAMMITVLYRMAGSPVVTSDNSTWYSDAMAWGSMNGIIDNGRNWTFEPEKNITRGTFACMLAAYNENVERKSSEGDALIFPDSTDFPEYAKTAAGWAGAQGIVTGRDSGEFDFYGEATRAELAAMLHRYIAD